jgi:hypothetical protein
MSTNSRLLGAKLRKPKARTLRDSDWDPYKDRISQLYSLHPLKDVIGIIEAETEFRARCVFCSRFEVQQNNSQYSPYDQRTAIQVSHQ